MMAEDIRSRQITEAESLEAIFGDDFSASGTWREDSLAEVAFVVNLGETAALRVSLPTDYPDASRPRTELTWSGSGDASCLRASLSSYVETLDLGDEMAYTIITWCQEQIADCDSLGPLVAEEQPAVAHVGADSTNAGYTSSALPIATADSVCVGGLPLSNYYRAEALGEGSFGSVMNVYDDDGQAFAAKQFERAEDDCVDTTTLREFGLLRALRSVQPNHPNVITIVDMADINGELCMIMESYRCSLADALHGGALGAAKGSQVRVASGCLSGVAFLHACRTMHRDIKPGNVMLTDSLDPVLIDFSLGKVDLGSARAADTAPRTAKERRQKKKEKKEKKSSKKQAKQEANGTDGARHSQGVGTPLYMAPEVIGTAEYGASADMWSLGIVLLEVFDNEFCTKFNECEKEKTAHALIAETVSRLGTKPIPSILRGTLEVDPSARMSARTALDLLRAATSKSPTDGNQTLDFPEVHLGSSVVDASSGLAEDVVKKLDQWSSFFQCSVRTRNYAAWYTSLSETATSNPLHALVLAGRLYENDPEATPFYDLEELLDWAFEDEDLDDVMADALETGLESYAEAELRILRELNYQLY